MHLLLFNLHDCTFNLYLPVVSDNQTFWKVFGGNEKIIQSEKKTKK